GTYPHRRAGVAWRSRGRWVDWGSHPGVPNMSLRLLRRHSVVAALALSSLLSCAPSAYALDWIWRYSDFDGVDARGTFVTTDVADAGWYEITAIAGERNGVAITALQPAGTW